MGYDNQINGLELDLLAINTWFENGMNAMAELLRSKSDFFPSLLNFASHL